MTYNIRGGLGLDGRRETARIAAVIAAQRPDVVCLQEVHQRLPWSRWIDQPGHFRRSLEMPFVFQKCFGYPWGGYGLGVATRLPIGRITRHRLHGQGEPRGALEVALEWNGKPITFWNTHWGLNTADRAVQAGQISDWMRGNNTSMVICGDLNETPGTDHVQNLMRTADLRDVGKEKDEPTYPADRPRARIDVVLNTPGLTPQRVFTVATQASDHVPLVVDFVVSDAGVV